MAGSKDQGSIEVEGDLHNVGGQVGTGTQVQNNYYGGAGPVDLAAAETALRQHMATCAQRLPEVFRFGRQQLAPEDITVRVDLSCAAGSRVWPDAFGGALTLAEVLREPVNCWALAGEPGAGKTTLLQVELGRRLKSKADLPVLLTVAEVLRARGLWAALDAITTGAGEVARHAAAEGRLTLLLDGYDEIEGGSQASRVAEGAATLLAVHDGNRMVVAGRPVGFEGAHPGPRFGDLRLEPLDAERAALLLGKRLGDAGRAQTAVARLRRQHLDAWVGNPLLLTLVAVLLYRDPDGAVPRSRTLLFDRALGVLLRAPYRASGGVGLNAAESAALARVALAVHGAPGDKVPLSHVEKALGSDSGPLLDKVIRVTRLLAVERDLFGLDDQVWFPHRLLREFLAALALDADIRARGIEDSHVTDALSRAESSPRAWAEVLAHTAGLLSVRDPRTGREPVVGAADALVRRALERSPALACRVVERAEGVGEDTVIAVLGVEGGRAWGNGYAPDASKRRSELLLSLPGRVGDLGAAVSAALAIAHRTGHGADLWHAGELLRRIAQGELTEPVADGTLEAARAEAEAGRERLFAHIPERRAAAVRVLLDVHWRLVPAGSFRMGSIEATDPDRWKDEGPQHAVHLTQGFRMLAVPVTNRMYECFDPGHRADRAFEGECGDTLDHPVVNVTWYEAAAFAEWLSRGLSEDCRLPTETEWEYACRGTTSLEQPSTRFWSGPADADLFAVGWVDKNSGGRTHAVDDLPTPRGREHPHGLLHLHGDVWEWCADWLGDYASDERRHDPQAVVGDRDPAAWRAIRGGSWINDPRSARSACRDWLQPSNRNDYRGFRLLLPGPFPPSR